jgi:steroid delta-isomerase-like uncharacterized protein
MEGAAMSDATGDHGKDADAARSLQALEEQIAAINAHDPGRLADSYGEDAVVRDPLYHEPLHGQAALLDDASAFFTAFPDVRAEVTSTLVDGSTVAVEMTMTATHTGPLPLPSGEVPPTGRPLTFTMSVFSRVDDRGLVVDERRYYDLAGQLEQLGLSG